MFEFAYLKTFSHLDYDTLMLIVRKNPYKINCELSDSSADRSTFHGS